ncbi:MAG TPA: glycosyltransferase family 9 protein [Opitutaceae bacterium]|nr:glycosyltransferase family 9 protein [Opitutaceae bacterium]
MELWGLGDLALAVPFLRVAAAQARVTLLAKPHAAPLLARFAPGVELVPFTAPWTAFRDKYRLHRWPWRELARVRRELRRRRFDLGVSARLDPRDHALLTLAGARRRLGFPRAGSHLLLTQPLPRPARPHRAEHWAGLAHALGWSLPMPEPGAKADGRRMVIHTGAGQPARRWPRERFEGIAGRLRAAGWDVTLLDDSLRDLEVLLSILAGADRFIGNDSGPGHLAALLGMPTFTIFGPSLPQYFAPRHSQSAWIEGASCPYKPCRDYCRFAVPHCIQAVSVEDAWGALGSWLENDLRKT